MESLQRRHSGFLDALRCAAILLVLLRHGVSTGQPTVSVSLSVGETIATNGWLGVDLFFVLSGYLLCSQVIDDRSMGGWRAGRFYLRRAIRILPPYLAVLFLCWFGALVPVLGTNGVLSPTVLLAHLLFVQDYTGAPLLVTLWSLATEEKFYLAIPLIATYLMRRGNVSAAVVLVLASLAVASARTFAVHLDAPADYARFFWEYRAPFHFAIDGLALGSGVAFAERQLTLSTPRARLLATTCGAVALIGMLAVLCAPGWLSGPSFTRASVAIWCFSACCGVLILTVRILALEQSLPAMPYLVTRFATLSYCLYLVHYPVAVMCHRLFPASGFPTPFWFVYLTSSILLAQMLSLITEAPLRRLRQRLRRGSAVEVTPEAQSMPAT